MCWETDGIYQKAKPERSIWILMPRSPAFRPIPSAPDERPGGTCDPGGAEVVIDKLAARLNMVMPAQCGELTSKFGYSFAVNQKKQDDEKQKSKQAVH